MPALFVTRLITRSGCNKNERGTDDENIIVPEFDLSCFGGEGEIRTLETLLGVTRFPVVRPRPG